LILASSLNHILYVGNGSGADFSHSPLLLLADQEFDFGDALDREFDFVDALDQEFNFGKESLSLSTALDQEFNFDDKILISVTSWNVEFDIFKNADSARF
jgi:hypothetical protein